MLREARDGTDMKNPFRASPPSKPMTYVGLGKAGLKVSRLCLGAMSFGSRDWAPWAIFEEESRGIIKRALELGVNIFDTADVYSSGMSEEILGRALRDFGRREQLVIATKVNGPMGLGVNDRGLSRKHICHAVDASLRRLSTDYIDLYQIHRWDYEVPIEETLQVLHDLIRSGKVLHIGASSMYAWEFARALYTADRHGWTRFVSMQNHYNLVYREEEREMIPLCRHEGVAILPWSPIARGLLAGTRHKTGRGETIRAKTDEYAHRLYRRESDFLVADCAERVARRRGVKPAQVALAWLLAQPGITSPVIGVTRMEHLEEAVAALDISLESDEIKILEEGYQPHPVLGHP